VESPVDQAVQAAQVVLAAVADTLAVLAELVVADTQSVVVVDILALVEGLQLAVEPAVDILRFVGAGHSLAAAAYIVVAGRSLWRGVRWLGGDIGLVECRVQCRWYCMLVARLGYCQSAYSRCRESLRRLRALSRVASWKKSCDGGI
jgi:hypothetical protein